jgi:hypothetical protein
MEFTDAELLTIQRALSTYISDYETPTDDMADAKTLLTRINGGG